MTTPLEIGIADAVAVIDEHRCIGCALCLQACPVDAIVGAAKLMHTVISSSCIGCELCLAPCPVDCIAMRQVGPRDALAREAALAEAERRHVRRNARLERVRDEKSARAAAQREEAAGRKKREAIAKAVERARERLGLRK
jgi:Na+-translocating ferredoxin:NAD+ oxidoreductase subunit B